MLQAVTATAFLSREDFRRVAELAYAHAGLMVREEKRVMVSGRLARRAATLGLDLDAYCRLLRGADAQAEIPFLINALTTNHTSFFREQHHFDHLRDVAVPTFAQRARARDGWVRAWSSASSTGEEPYSIATILRASLGRGPLPGLRLLATDIDTDVLATAAARTYPLESIEDAPKAWSTVLVGERCPSGKDFTVADDVAELVSFRRLNLIGPWPMQAGYDVIFCRNVFIYFDGPTKSRLVDRFAELLRPGGFLYLGHTEFLSAPHPRLTAVGRTIYRRPS